MITPEELFKRSDKLFFKVVSSVIRGDDLFPLIIPGNKKLSGLTYSDIKSDILPLYKNSKENKEFSYTIDWKERTVNGARQKIPFRIYFETLDDFLTYTKRKSDFDKITDSTKILLFEFPQLKQWAELNPKLLLEYFDCIPDIIKVCKYFVQNLPPHKYYLRELPIKVHTKFIEDNYSILKVLLDLLLPDSSKNILDNDFAGRYFLKRPEVLAYLRVLDENLKSKIGFNQLALGLEDVAQLDWVPENTFIIENKICYLTFPYLKNSVAIFGEGFKSKMTRNIPWLSKTRLYCWFDLDAAGFEILNMIRQYYPEAISFLMDRLTFDSYNQFVVSNNAKKKDLVHLTNIENEMFNHLCINGLRLEQERIPLEFVKSQVQKLMIK